MKHLLCLATATLTLTINLPAADNTPVHILVWDERQPRQEEAYENFLGNEIAAQLQALPNTKFHIRSVALDDPNQGLADKNLDWADVLVWWGHVRHDDVTDENTQRILDRIIAGDLDLIALHSAHFAKPFMEAMNWRTREDARAHFGELDPDMPITFQEVLAPKTRTVPTYGSALTPAYFAYKLNKTNHLAFIHLPWCCFPAFRPDGEPGTITITNPNHPIAAGLPPVWQITQTEMYDEPFHVPTPDEVVFEEDWELGEHFRSGIVWNIGEGKVFYFRPGHETYPIFKQPEVIQVLANAAQWLGQN
ncbi:MAG: ThuA domain-containing protein [Verrucomicrobiota bacterium]